MKESIDRSTGEPKFKEGELVPLHDPTKILERVGPVTFRLSHIGKKAI